MNIQGMSQPHGDRQESTAVAVGRSHCSSDLEFDSFTAFEGGAPATGYSSPAISTAFDMNASSSSVSNMGTVSPQDLMIREPFGSAPNSTAFTALTSPSIYNESPDLHGSYDVSPNFASGDVDGTADWFSLFPDANNKAPEQQSVGSEDSPAQKSDEIELGGHKSSHRRTKSGNNSPGSGRRHSSVAGVNSRRRDKPLPAIIVEDPNDPVAMKRARNTLAARKSRDRKAKKSEEQEAEIARLTAEVDYWKERALSSGR